MGKKEKRKRQKRWKNKQKERMWKIIIKKFAPKTRSWFYNCRLIKCHKFLTWPFQLFKQVQMLILHHWALWWHNTCSIAISINWTVSTSKQTPNHNCFFEIMQIKVPIWIQSFKKSNNIRCHINTKFKTT